MKEEAVGSPDSYREQLAVEENQESRARSQEPGGDTFRHGKPFGTRVIIKADEAMAATPGGIIIPEMARERPQFGTVLAVGPQVTEDVNEGDRVVFGKHAGVPLIIQGVTYYVMQERELFMKLDEGELEKDVSGLLGRK